MKINKIIIILGTAHQKSILGKASPDGKFKEYQYSRKVVKEVYKMLKAKGYEVYIDVEDDDLKLSQAAELKYRCAFVNNIYKQHKNCIYVSIHVNAAGNGSKWMTASGWEAWTSVGKTKSDKLAEYLYEAASKYLKGKKIRKDTSDNDSDKESNFYVLYHTNCPAVLTENFFQDNKEDVEFLTSKEGFDKIVRLHVEGIINFIEDN